jgi:MmyB-like transcription regulator ligand binding domain
VLRLSLHPGGIASRIVNLAEWRAHLLDRLDRDISSTADRGLIQLRDELLTYPCPPAGLRPDTTAILVPMKLRVQDVTLSLFSTTTVFGTPRDVTLAELAIESFYPADQDSAGYLASRAAAARGRAGA